MTQEEKMQKQITELATIVPVMQKQLEEQAETTKKIWKWISGNSKEGAAEILRRHEAFIQEMIANRKSNKKLLVEKLTYLVTGTVLALGTWLIMSAFGG
jgi:hypothetical protein